MRKPGLQDDQGPVTINCTRSSSNNRASSSHNGSNTGLTGCSNKGDFHEENSNHQLQQQQQTPAIQSRPRACLKLRDCTNTFQHSTVILPPCPSFTTGYNNSNNGSGSKASMINFDLRQGLRTRRLETPGYNPLFDAYHSIGSRVSRNRLQQDSIILGSSINTSSSRLKESVSKEGKFGRKERGESCQNHNASQQDGSFSNNSSAKDQENYVQPVELYGEKLSKKSSKSQKIKYRHPSKSIAMNLNEMITIKNKKPKTKRPVTSHPDLLEDTMSFSQKITTKIFNTKSASSTKKENLPPITKIPACNSSCNSDKEDTPHLHTGCSGGKNCSKCTTMAQKLKSQVQVAKTLQKQNGCLENIVTQKRNLVEQLTRQVRTLVRENQQLAKGCGKLPLETMLSTESSSSLPKIAATNALDRMDESYGDGNDNEGSRNDHRVGNEGTTLPLSNSPENTLKNGESKEKLEEAEQRLSCLNLKCENIQQHYNLVRKENQEINRFLTDLLYTLNARGYESITDHEGNTIDLYRCKGESFLDLRGRDARQRAPAKRLAPQETLLKAVIGSQERIIQNLIVQLEDYQHKDSLIGQRLSLDNFHCQEGSRHAILEADILTLFSLIEGACQRSPEIYSILKAQHAFDSQVKANSGLNPASAIVEAMLERCQKALNSMTPAAITPSTPPLTPQKLRGRSASPAALPARFGAMQGHITRNLAVHENYPQQHLNLDPKVNNTKQISKSEMEFHPKGGTGRISRGQVLPEIPPRRFPPPLSRSNSQTQATAAGSNLLGPVRTANNSSMNGMSGPPQRLRPNTSDNSINSQLANSSGNNSTSSIEPTSVSVEKRIPILDGDRCPLCARQFSANTSLAEINSHMKMHSYQAG